MIQSLKARHSNGLQRSGYDIVLKSLESSSDSQSAQKGLYGLIQHARLLDHHHMPRLRDEDKPRIANIFIEISGMLDRGQLVLLPTEDKGWKSDLREPTPDIKMVTCLEIVEYDWGWALSGHADEALFHCEGCG